VGISLDNPVPDHSVISRFRIELTQKGVYEKLFKAMNKQLKKHKIIVKTGVIEDASIIDTPLKPKGKTTYEIQVDRSEQERIPEGQENEQQMQLLIKMVHPGVDSEARWIKKAGETRYAFKKHHLTNT